MKRVSISRLGALVVASGLATGGAVQSRSWAGIVPLTRGTTNVSGVVIEGPPNQNPTERRSYNDGSPAVEGASVHVSISGHAEIPPGAPTPNASASSSASQDTLITFDPGRDLLELNSTNVVRTDTTLAPPTQTRADNGHAEAQSTFSTNFTLTDHAYDYALTLGDFLLNHVGPEPSAGFARVELRSNSTGQGLFFKEFSLFDGTTTTTGSSGGTLAPGDYRLTIDLFGPTSGAGGHTDGRLVAGLGLHGAAPEIKWANTAGGSFQTNTNWDPQRVPVASERAAFDLAGNYTVTLDQDATNDRLRANGAGVNVNFDLAGHNYTVDQFNVGGRPGDSGTFTIKDSGGITVSAATPGGPRPAQPTPPVTFKAASMSVRGAETVEIAAATTSDLVTVDDGGGVIAAGAAAQWTATTLLVGGAGRADVTLSNKATLVNQSATIGGASGGGTVTVTGADTAWSCDRLAVSGAGPGLVNVVSGGTLTVKTLGAGTGFDTTGSVVVDGTNSALFQAGSGEAVVGDAGTGSLKVRNGAVYDGHNGTLTIGKSSLGSGDVAVAGRGSIAVASLNVGTGGPGVLTLDDRADVSVSPVGLPGAAVVGPRGQVAVNANSTFVSGQSLRVDGAFRVDPATGQAIVGDNPGTFGRGKLFVSTNGTLSGTGTIFGRLLLAGGANGFAGRVEPGNSPGTLTVAGDFEQQAGGVLGIQIAGRSPGQFDVLKVDADAGAGLLGDARIGGDLTLEFLDGFAPRAGDRFDFLTAAGALTGQFQHVEVLNLAPGFQFDLRNEGGRFALVALNDGTAVPEPATAALLLLSCVPFARRRRSRR